LQGYGQYLAGGAGLGYLLWRSLPIYFAGPLIIGILGLGASLAFFNFNGQPFILALEHAFFYLVRGKLYLWSNEQAVSVKKKKGGSIAVSNASPAPYVPHLSESKLHELAWSLDIKERINAGTADAKDREGAAREQDIVAPIRTAKTAMVR